MTYPAPKLPIIVSWTSLLLAAAGAHLALALLLPEQKWVTPLGVSLAVAVAAAFCLAQAKRRTGLLRLRWCLLAAGMGLWILAYGLSAYSQMSNADTAVALPYLMVFSLRAIPWLLAIVLTSNRKVLAHTGVFDGVQAMLLILAISLLYFPQIAAGATFTVPAVSGERAYTYHELVNVVIAVLSVAFIPLQPTQAERRFAASAAVLLSIYAGMALLVNQVIINGLAPPPGSPWFLLGDLAAVVFVVHHIIAERRTAADDDEPRKPGPVKTLALLLVPAVAPMAVVLISIVLADYHPMLAAALACAALLLYVGRSVLTQHAYQRVQADLEKANARMFWLAEHDALTGLPNRRKFNQSLEAQWHVHATSRKPLGLLFIDIDFFKLFNDTLGHAAGDACLEKVARLLQTGAYIHPDALVARYGGEEFVILLNDCSRKKVLACAEHIREHVAQACIPHLACPTGLLSLSIGVACADPSSDGPHSHILLENADVALYVAKQRGRNQVADGLGDELAVISLEPS